MKKEHAGGVGWRALQAASRLNEYASARLDWAAVVGIRPSPYEQRLRTLVKKSRSGSKRKDLCVKYFSVVGARWLAQEYRAKEYWKASDVNDYILKRCGAGIQQMIGSGARAVVPLAEERTPEPRRISTIEICVNGFRFKRYV